MVSSSFKVLTSSDSNEWFTPAHIIDDVRTVLGGIDIDPASCDYANQTVKATTYYTKDSDGFNRLWFGRLWLNPPYGNKSKKTGNYGASAWFEKAYEEYLFKHVSSGCVLGRGDSDGVKTLAENFIFLDNVRISFYNPDTPASSPVPGSRIFYMGDRPSDFIDVFRKYGLILRAI